MNWSRMTWVAVGGMVLAGLTIAQQRKAVGKKDVGKKLVEAPIKKAIEKEFDVDLGKSIVERPIKKAIADKPRYIVPTNAPSVALEARPDVGKFRVETVIKHKLARPSSVNGRVAGRTAQDKPAPIGAGKKVAAGLVRWHESFEAAIAAAKKSGKPVFFFQLLGKLDDEFC